MFGTKRALRSGLRFALAVILALGPALGRPAELLARVVSGRTVVSVSRGVPAIAPVGSSHGSAGLTPLPPSVGLSSILPVSPVLPVVRENVEARPGSFAPEAPPVAAEISASPLLSAPIVPHLALPAAPVREASSSDRDSRTQARAQPTLTSLGTDLAAASIGDAPRILGQAFDGAHRLSPKGSIRGRTRENRALAERLVRAGAREASDVIGGASLGEMNLVEADASRRTGTLSATFRDARGNEARLTNLDVEGRLGELGHLSLGLSIRSRANLTDLSLTPARIARDPSRLDVMRSILPLLKRAVDAPPSSRSFSSKELYAARTLVERMERLEREVGAQLSSPLVPPGLDLSRLKPLRAGGDAFAPWVLFSAPGYRVRLTTVKTAEGAASSVFSIHMEVYEKRAKRPFAYVRLDPGTLEKDSRVPGAARRLLAGLRTSAWVETTIAQVHGPKTRPVMDEAIEFLERLAAPKAPTERATLPAAALLPLAASGAQLLGSVLAGPLIGTAAGLVLGWLVWKLKANKTNKERWYPSLTLFPNAVMGAFFGFLLAQVYQAGSLTMTLSTGAVMLAAQLWMNLSPIGTRLDR